MAKSNCKHFPEADDYCLVCAREENDVEMLGKIVSALVAYHGPITVIEQVITVTDMVITDMALNGRITEAKNLADILENVRLVLK